MQDLALTCGFKLMQPNKGKAQILERAFDEYTRGAESILDWFREACGDLLENGQALKTDKATGKLVKTGKYTGDSVYGFLSRRRPGSTWSNIRLGSNFKKGLFADVCSQMAGHVELSKVQENAGFPSAVIRQEDTERSALEAYEALRCDYLDIDLEDPKEWKIEAINREGDLKKSILRRNHGKLYRTITTCSKGTSDDAFYLLANPQLTSFYVWLPLLPQDNDLISSPIKYDGLIDIGTGEAFVKRSKLAVLLPLELGKKRGAWGWQYTNFLQPCMSGRCEYKSAKLSWRDDGIYLFVNFVYSVPDAYSPTCWIGVTSDLLYGVDYSIIDSQGRVLDSGREGGSLIADLNLRSNQTVAERQRRGVNVTIKDYYKQHKESLLHKIVNHLVSLALSINAGIVLEEPRESGGGWARVPHQKLMFIFAYKCKLNSVPFRPMFGAQAHNICPRCGSALDRLDCNHAPIKPGAKKKYQGPYYGRCSSCGSVALLATIKSINVARRINYKRADWEKKGGYLGFHRSFDRLYKRSKLGDAVSLAE